MGFYLGGFPPLFTIIFIIIFGVIIYSVLNNAKNYHRNASSPILSQHSRVVAKRTEVSGSSSMNNNHTHHSTRTRYYATFETDVGQRMELTLSGREYGLLAEGDSGLLTYQGEWYKNFERDLL